MRRYSVAGINFLVICSSINGLFFFSRLQQNCKFFCSGAVVLRVQNSAAVAAITMLYIGYVGGAGSQFMSRLSQWSFFD